MNTIKQLLTFSLATLLAPLASATVVNFHFGAAVQTGAAALGAAGDKWNAANVINGSNLALVDSTGASTPITVSWTSGTTPTQTGTITAYKTGTSMDTATAPLMTSYAQSPAVNTTDWTNLSVTISGLAKYKVYTVAVYGAGTQVGEGTNFVVTGCVSYWPMTVGINRQISDGIGNAYAVVSVMSSATGTIAIHTKGNGFLPYTVMNGFQLQLGTVTPNTTIPVTVAAPIKNWGVNGHPALPDYASYVAANSTTQMTDIKSLGAAWYRTMLEGTGPTYLDNIAPQAKTAGVNLLVNIPLTFVAASSGQTNYNTNYTTAYNWASYAISKGYAVTYWELGNEPENRGLVSIVGDGASPAQFPDKVPGGFVAIASGLMGAYDGVKQAYTDGRAAGKTTITPLCLTGMCFHHWGLLAKIQAYDGELPCDIISWHWYGPVYGDFSAPTSALGQPDDGRIPAACLADFKSKTDPTKPMDVWITETGRSQNISGVLYNGSVSNNATPKTSQDWAAQATAIQGTCDSFKKVSTVKAVFVYELYDETINYASSTSGLAVEGYMGLITGLHGTKKNAFTTFQTEIKTAQ